MPESLGNLTALTSLSLSGNQLTHCPSGWRISWLAAFSWDLRGIRWLIRCRSLLQRGAAELATYLRSLHDAEPQYEAKLLVVGEGNVGKTSLIAALRSAPFVEGGRRRMASRSRRSLSVIPRLTET